MKTVEGSRTESAEEQDRIADPQRYGRIEGSTFPDGPNPNELPRVRAPVGKRFVREISITLAHRDLRILGELERTIIQALHADKKSFKRGVEKYVSHGAVIE